MKPKALFLDRDGVINIDHGYVGTLDRFDFQDGIFALLNRAQDWGYRLVIITNQAGVARGYYSENDFKNVTQHMRAQLAQQGIALDLVMACFEHPEGSIQPYIRPSYWRKPHPGMILDAAQQLGLDLARSVFVGDQLTDMHAARAAGVGQRLWLCGQDKLGGGGEDEGCTSIVSLAEAQALLRPYL